MAGLGRGRRKEKVQAFQPTLLFPFAAITLIPKQTCTPLFSMGHPTRSPILPVPLHVLI